MPASHFNGQSSQIASMCCTQNNTAVSLSPWNSLALSFLTSNISFTDKTIHNARNDKWTSIFCQANKTNNPTNECPYFVKQTKQMSIFCQANKTNNHKAALISNQKSTHEWAWFDIVTMGDNGKLHAHAIHISLIDSKEIKSNQSNQIHLYYP